MSKPLSMGHAIPEYALVLGLVALVAVGGLSLLGNSISNLLGGTVNQAVNGSGSASGLMALLSPQGNSSGMAVAAGAAPSGAAGQVDPQTGQPVMGMADTIGSGTNTTSVEGVSQDSVGSFALSSQVEQLAVSDPENAPKYKEIADLMYWMGGTQGYIDNISVLSVYGQSARLGNYGPPDAMADMADYSRRLSSLVSGFPPDSPNYETVQELAEHAQSIAHSDYYLGQAGNLDALKTNPYSFDERLQEYNVDIREVSSLLISTHPGSTSGSIATFSDAAQLDQKAVQAGATTVVSSSSGRSANSKSVSVNRSGSSSKASSITSSVTTTVKAATGKVRAQTASIKANAASVVQVTGK